MKKKALLPLFLGIMVFLAGCDYSLKLKNVVGFFIQYIRRSNEKCIGLVGK